MPRERKPLDEHALQGTKAHYLEVDSLVVASRPKIPTEFKKRPPLKKLFKDYCKALEKRRTLTSGDAELLRLVVLCRDRHARAISHVLIEGEIVSYDRLDAHGEIVKSVAPNLWLKVAQESEKTIVSILDRLGLTPTNRGKVKQASAPKPDTSADDALLSRDAAAKLKEEEPEPDLDALLQTAEGIQ